MLNNEETDLFDKDRNLNVITEPTQVSERIRVAMIEHNGTPIELMEFKKGYRVNS